MLEVIETAIEDGYLILEHITPKRFEKAKILRMRLQFTDLTFMVVMTELGITHILTEDEHFTYVGMGFQRVL